MLGGDAAAARRTALHETGHVLGLVHEFQNPAAAGLFQPDQLVAYFTGPPNHWSRETIFHNFAAAEAYPGSRDYDPDSIMNYEFPAEIFAPGQRTSPGNELSASDLRYVAELYPRA